MAQGGACIGVGIVRPQQGGKRTARMRPICLDRQIGQQRPHFVGLEIDDGFAIQSGVKPPKKPKR